MMATDAIDEHSLEDRQAILSAGAARYRAGEYERSLLVHERLLPSLDLYAAMSTFPFLAMAHHRLGHTESAKQCLGKARQSLEEAMAGDKRSVELSRGVLIAGIYLTHEAANLIEGRPYAPPTAAEMLAMWQEFSAKLPPEYQDLKRDKIEWHRAEAMRAEKRQDWFGAVFHLEKLSETALVDGTIRPRLASARKALSKLPPTPMDIHVEEISRLGIPARDPRAAPNLIDLTAFYNAELTNSWYGPVDMGNDLAPLPQGLQQLAGVSFDVRGIIQLYQAPGAPRFPKAVSGIPISRHCQRIHFLHAGAVPKELPEELPLAKYVFHFVDGQKAEMPICKGLDIRDWWVKPGVPRETKRSVEAWTGTNAMGIIKQRPIRLFKSTWENPRPNVEVKNIDYVSMISEAGPFLVAITAE
jgi:hypothetical protein